MTIPSNASNANCDSLADDPKDALTVDLKVLIDDYNTLLQHLRDQGRYPAEHINGLIMQNDAVDTAHDIEIGIGACRSGDDTVDMDLTSVLTKRIDAAWAVGDNNGGMDTGSVTNDTTYHVWLIKRTDTGVVDALFSLSATSPTMPTDYDEKRLIGSILTDASSNIRQFKQFYDRFELLTPQEELGGSTAATAEQTLALTGVPTGVQVLVELNIHSEQSSATQRSTRIYPMDGDDLSPGDTTLTISGQSTGADVISFGNSVRVMTDTSAQIHYRTNQSTNMWITSVAWTHPRGKQWAA